jgi:DNA invertase Pin-like site-specific DNA recombinase
MTVFGYARVSTREQETFLQLDALKAAGCTEVFQEKASGASQRGRPELARCLDALRPGDTLVVYKIDRIARSLADLLDILRRLERTGAMIRSVTEPLDTTTSMGMFVVQVLGSVAQLERAIIRERSIAGQQAAKLRGVSLGRKRTLTAEDEAEIVRRYVAGGVTQAGLAAEYGVSASVIKRAVYRVVKPREYQKRSKV